MVFETERLIVKKLSMKDIDDFHRIYGDKEVMEKIPAPVFSLDESKAELLNIINAYTVDKHRLRIWGVFIKNKMRLIGVCASIGTSEHCRNIGYRIIKEYWGQGFGSELTGGLISYLRQDISIQFITAEVDKENTASIRILNRHMIFEKERYDTEMGRYELCYKISLLEINQK